MREKTLTVEVNDTFLISPSSVNLQVLFLIRNLRNATSLLLQVSEWFLMKGLYEERSW